MSYILIFNVGSSSLTYKVFHQDKAVCYGKANRVNVKGIDPPFIEHNVNGVNEKIQTKTLNHAEAAEMIIKYLLDKKVTITHVGHRFVHGGEYFKKSAIITPEVLKELKECLPFAPIHNPSSYSVIEVSMKLLPDTQQYVAIDTAFHSTIPKINRIYAIPQPYQDEYLKFGFHGLSYEFVLTSLKERMDVSNKKIVACHLGTGGSSCCAILNGESFDTSMGNSTLAGLVMSTRCGDIDPTIPINLVEKIGVDKTIELLNKKSGLLGLSDLSSDMRDILKEISNKNTRMDQRRKHAKTHLMFM